MSFKMDFFGKVVDQFRGLFQPNQKSTTNPTTTMTNCADNDGSTTSLEPPPIPTNNRPTTITNSPWTKSSSRPSSNTNNIFQVNNTKNNNNEKTSVKKIDATSVSNKFCNQQHPPQANATTATSTHQHVFPPSSLSLSNWSGWASSPGNTPSSVGAGANGSGNVPSSSTSPLNNNNNSNHNYLHYHPSNSHQPQLQLSINNYHYAQPLSQNHQQHRSSLEHSYNNFNQSSSSSSTSFGVPLTPSTASSGIGPRSYSAINTPDSPVNFRRQHSLNVNQRMQASSRLQLDLRSQKNSPLYAKQSASTDLIDKHSLSPRPRPKDLNLSSSQDNILKGHNYPYHQPHHPHHLSSSQHTHKGTSVNHNNQHQQQTSQPRPGGFLNSISFGVVNNGGQDIENSSRVGGTGAGGSSSHSAYYQNRMELSRNNSSLKINGRVYDNLQESDFKEISRLGAGSFGQVDKMLHKISNIELAVKKVRRSGSVEDNRHVKRDLELLQKCNYEHVVTCYGFFILETEIWIFMELMSTCFDHLIKKLALTNETVPERIIGKVAVATINTLDYLKKEHQVIHRDIKPSNILINNLGIIKLCDFGISGSLINSRAHTRSVGSTAYMAPERIEPPPDGTYDIRSDIWSMGITLIEIATGQFPYKNWATDFEILSKVIQEPPPTLPDDLDFSDDFRSFIKECLIKDYRARPKYEKLKECAFYIHYKDALIDVAEWFEHAYCDTSSNNHKAAGDHQNNRSHSSSTSSLASNSTIK